MNIYELITKTTLQKNNLSVLDRIGENYVRFEDIKRQVLLNFKYTYGNKKINDTGLFLYHNREIILDKLDWSEYNGIFEFDKIPSNIYSDWVNYVNNNLENFKRLNPKVKSRSPEKKYSAMVSNYLEAINIIFSLNCPMCNNVILYGTPSYLGKSTNDYIHFCSKKCYSEYKINFKD